MKDKIQLLEERIRQFPYGTTRGVIEKLKPHESFTISLNIEYGKPLQGYTFTYKQARIALARAVLKGLP